MPPRDEIADRINGYITKYMGILQIAGEPPVIKLRSNLGSKWLGRSTWKPSSPSTTLLELQTSILGDDRTLERVIAHEMIHHRDALALSENDVALLRVGIKPDAHGATFREGCCAHQCVHGIRLRHGGLRPAVRANVSSKEVRRPDHPAAGWSAWLDMGGATRPQGAELGRRTHRARIPPGTHDRRAVDTRSQDRALRWVLGTENRRRRRPAESLV